MLGRRKFLSGVSSAAIAACAPVPVPAKSYLERVLIEYPPFRYNIVIPEWESAYFWELIPATASQADLDKWAECTFPGAVHVR